MLGASLGRSDKARPAFIALGFVGSFAAAAVFFSVTTQVAGIDQTVLRAVAAVLLAAFGAVMLWPHPFEWIWIRVGARLIPGDVIVAGFGIRCTNDIHFFVRLSSNGGCCSRVADGSLGPCTS
jgi:hypothetical protein